MIFFHFRKQCVKVFRIRCGVCCRHVPDAVPGLDRGKQSASTVGKKMFQQKCGRGFTVGSGHAQQRKIKIRISLLRPEKQCRCSGRILNPVAGNVRRDPDRQRTAVNDRRRPVHHLRKKIVTIRPCAGNCDKYSARLEFPGVTGNAGGQGNIVAGNRRIKSSKDFRTGSFHLVHLIFLFEICLFRLFRQCPFDADPAGSLGENNFAGYGKLRHRFPGVCGIFKKFHLIFFCGFGKGFAE